MKQGFMHRVKRLIDQADVIVEVLDARFPEATHNTDFEDLIGRKKKKLVLVLNKSDLVSASKAKKWEKKLKAISLSSTQRTGLNNLRKRINMALKNKEGVVAIIGYPNTGKSSLINALKGKKVAPVSAAAGFTRGEKMIRISQQIMLVDSPGIIPFGERDEFRLILSSSKNPNQLKDAETVALKLIGLFLEEKPDVLVKAYGIKSTVPEKILEEIALQKRKLLKGGLPDIETAARLLVADYQKGKIRLE